LLAPIRRGNILPVDDSMAMHREEWAHMRAEVIKANLCVFIASFCTLVIELVAGRIMAPYVGVSLYTWTSIIGVVLAGISVGAYLGGLLADRFPSYATLGWLLLFSGLSAFGIGPLADFIREGNFLGQRGLETSLMTRILMITTVIFFVPALLLGMISPVVVKLSVRNLDQTGNVVGKIYAFSTLGSILGTFATGFFLVAYLGARLILFTVGVVLVLCAPLFGELLAGRRGPRAVLMLACLLLLVGWAVFLWRVPRYDAEWLDHIQDQVRQVREGGALGQEQAPLKTRLYGAIAKPADARRPDWEYYFYKESDYYTIKLSSLPRVEEQGWTEVLSLDHLIHSFSDVTDPYYLKYDYLSIYDELIAWRMSATPDRKTLFIGGGGYTFPRLMELKYPRARIDVVEIDPEVTRVAREYLGVGTDSRIRDFNMDGRWYVMNCREQYDFIIGEAFNDVSIPYHLTTKQFAEEMKAILKPDGLLIALVIDSVKTGQFMPSYMRTLEAVFGKGNVQLVTVGQALDETCANLGMGTHVIVAGQGLRDLNDFDHFRRDFLARAEAARGLAVASLATQPLAGVAGMAPPSLLAGPLFSTNHVARPALVQRYLRLRPSVVLTDDYAPVDYLIAPLFEERFQMSRHR
jgi:spermidine synthase/MFS family permease